MPIEQVEALLGKPDTVNVRVYGGESGVQVWTGKLVYYSWGSRKISITYYDSNGSWRVNDFYVPEP